MSSKHPLTVVTRTMAVSAALAALVAGCSSAAERPAADEVPASTQTAQPTEAEHNEADTTFAQMMIIHHEGAIEMAELAMTSASTEDVRTLGERIAAAQGPEIDTMSGWLDAWDEDQPDEADMTGMGHSGMEMDGMDQETVMAELSGLTGPAVDRRFLELMIDHHRGAITMAEVQRAEGMNPDAIQLAGTIIDAQTAEITEMDNLLRSL
jgi:uncharacterized protein (DUF305 family)